jgi:hypothetical protein
MVTFWPPAVVSVKPDGDVLLTVPADPPGSGPLRALDPEPPPGPLLAVDEPLPVVALTKCAGIKLDARRQVAPRGLTFS